MTNNAGNFEDFTHLIFTMRLFTFITVFVALAVSASAQNTGGLNILDDDPILDGSPVAIAI
ncbi:hypothetical protein AZE42_14134 [Rhizopogon vesiculosus]|nr:hypothetical protein AZE42_14134 [Rhizopogon vesiculosus]